MFELKIASDWTEDVAADWSELATAVVAAIGLAATVFRFDMDREHQGKPRKERSSSTGATAIKSGDELSRRKRLFDGCSTTSGRSRR